MSRIAFRKKVNLCALIEDMLGMQIPSLDRMQTKDVEALYHALESKLREVNMV